MTTSGATRISSFALHSSCNMMARGRRLLGGLAAALFPPRCILCSDSVPTLDSLCPQCEATLPTLHGPRCQRCGDPVDSPLIDLCLPCGTQRHAVDRILSLGPYQGAWGHLVRAFKFEREIAIGRWLGVRMADMLLTDPCCQDLDAITFVPMTRRDQRRRGFNQAEVMARLIGRRLSLPVVQLLAKTRETELQSGLSAVKRKSNLRDAFRLLPCVQDHVLLVDDICTTGATVEECARMLKRGGAQSVVAMTVARA